MSDALEIEAKFDLDASDRELLLAMTTVGPFRVSDRSDVVQDDVYYDTDAALLKAAGATLRVRRTAKGARMTFKGRRQESTSEDDGHIAARPEDEVALSDAQVESIAEGEPLPDLADLSPLERARAIAGNDALLPVAHLHNSRVTLVLTSDASTMELALDDCTGTRLADGRTVRFHEVELEAKSGDRIAVIAASDALRALVPSLTPSRETKLGRTLD